MKRSKRTLSLLLLPLLVLCIAPLKAAFPADPDASKVRKQTTVTILHVDKFGVYSPGMVFYWDVGMNKQTVASLTSAAEHLRNKKALVTYLVDGDPAKAKRPLLLELSAAREDTGASEVESSVLPALEKPMPEKAVPEKPALQKPVPEKPAAERVVSSDNGPASEKWPVPDKRPELPKPQEPPRPPQAESRPPAVTPVTEPPRQIAKATPEESARTATTSGDMPRIASIPPVRSASITKEEVTRLITLMMALNEKKDIGSILPYYADQVDYYSRGPVNREYIRKDMGYYFRNWDRIRSALDGDVVFIVTDEQDMRIVKFVTSFSVENMKKAVAGKTENVWKVKKINDELKITDVKQRVISSESR